MTTDLPTLEAALKLADQDCPLPSLAGPALKVLRDHVSQLNTKLRDMAGVMLEHCTGWDIRFVGCAPIAEVARKRGLEIGTSLYTAPPIDLAAVREVIAELRGWDKRYHGLHGLAGKLEATIKGES